ncbi:hypothetical protein LTR85_007574 [Meristemomyces frigidus]|nr:hypothetical protein LTR85_007574 [Meristemomyces frigidus]
MASKSPRSHQGVGKTTLSSELINQKWQSFTKLFKREKLFRRVPAGYGGTYLFGGGSSISRIGTDHCQTCVGVYFVIDGQRYFAAHIQCWVEASDTTAAGLRIPNAATYQRLQQEITQRLDVEAAQSGWLQPSEAMRNSLVMVCKAQVTDSQGRQSWDTVVGNCIADAVAGWLGVPEGDARRRPSERGGFIVKHPGQKRKMFDHLIDTSRWTAVPDHPQDRQRDFGV